MFHYSSFSPCKSCYIPFYGFMFLGLYRYLGVVTPATTYRIPLSEKIYTPHPQPWTSAWISDQKFHKIVKSCSPTESISIGAEGIDNNFFLELKFNQSIYLNSVGYFESFFYRL